MNTKNLKLLFAGFIALALVSALIVKSNRASAQTFDGEIFAPTATFIVTNTGDTGAGSLRQAILDANGTAGSDLITFSIVGTGPFTIQPLSALPDITEAVTIDGYTQTGATANANCTGTAVLQIVVNGASAGAASSGLTLAAGSTGSTVRGLNIQGFDGNGIEILSGSNAITGNFIGTNAAGTAAVPNNSNGINITSGSTNTIGGTTPGLRNVISGNLERGIAISGFAGSGSNRIQGNYIGTDATGNADLGNSFDGVDISQSAGNGIGGSATTLGCAPGNLISGNNEDGISIFGTNSTGNLVGGNLIGTNAAGTADLGNSSQGIYLNAVSNQIGVGTADFRNVISGNDGGGINLGGGNSNVVRGNYIGTNLGGTAALRNPDGVRIDTGANNNQIGGGLSGEGNVISGNDTGVHIAGGNNNIVSGNLIGTGADGTSDVGNLEAGVYIHEPKATSNTIGGAGAGEGNNIRFNGDGTLIPTLAGEGGIVVYFGSTGNRISSNGITNNTGLGIDLGLNGANGVTPNDANDVDSGDANNFQNYPVLVTVNNTGGMTTITGTLNSTPSRLFRVEFFSDTTADASGNGEGRIFIGAQNYTTDASGNAAINFSTATQVPTGNFVSATATDSTTGDTSEFSMSRQIAGPTAATASISGRLRTAAGAGISGVSVTLFNTQSGETITVTTGLNGMYVFESVPVGDDYIITPTALGFTFSPSSRFLSLTEELTSVDFVAVRRGRFR